MMGGCNIGFPVFVCVPPKGVHVFYDKSISFFISYCVSRLVCRVVVSAGQDGAFAYAIAWVVFSLCFFS